MPRARAAAERTSQHNADFLARIQGGLNLIKRAVHGIIGVVFRIR